MLSNNAFLGVVADAPLVAIDLIVPNNDGRILVGQRVNRPARGLWFLPGGRIIKGESLDEAFERIARAELGVTGAKRSDALFLGVYEHFYEDNFASHPGVSTHYVVLGYRVAEKLTVQLTLPHAQHASYRWLGIQDLLVDDGVHDNTKRYFGQAAV